jgi:hypothetical protein
VPKQVEYGMFRTYLEVVQSNLLLFQLKATYNSIEAYRNASGFHFDNMNGANVHGETATGIWNGIVAKKVCLYV